MAETTGEGVGVDDLSWWNRGPAMSVCKPARWPLHAGIFVLKAMSGAKMGHITNVREVFHNFGYCFRQLKQEVSLFYIIFVPLSLCIVCARVRLCSSNKK